MDTGRAGERTLLWAPSGEEASNILRSSSHRWWALFVDELSNWLIRAIRLAMPYMFFLAASIIFLTEGATGTASRRKDETRN